VAGFGDVVSQLRSTIRDDGWTPGRGDYGADHSSGLIAIIEDHNCVKGCTLSGTRAARREFGPGGNCSILARVAIGDNEPIRELDPRREGPHCTARIPPPEPDPPKPRRRPDNPGGTEPLFDL
jgi:hypothetical protein